MPTLTNPTAEQVSTLVRDEIVKRNNRKHSQYRRLDPATVATAVVTEIFAKGKPAGALDADGGTHASTYPATTVTLACAWYTRDNGDLVVYVRGRRWTLGAQTDAVQPPYDCPAGYVEGLIAAGGFAVLVDPVLRGIYESLKGSADPMAAAVYANPGDMTAWVAYADRLDETAGGYLDAQAAVATSIRERVCGVKSAA